MRIYFKLGLIFFLLFLCGCATTVKLLPPYLVDLYEELYVGIPNFHKVTPYLYRGSMPSKRALFALRKLGVKTVIDLRDEHDVTDEREIAEVLQMKFEHIPIDALKRPTRGDLERFLAVVDEPLNRPVFIHCEQGMNRTGALIAAYRILRQNWTVERAYQEARHYGLKKFLVGLNEFILNDIKRPPQRAN